MFDLRLAKRVKNGPAGRFSGNESFKLYSAINVVRYLLGIISTNRKNDMDADIRKAIESIYNKNGNLQSVIAITSGLTNKF